MELQTLLFLTFLEPELSEKNRFQKLKTLLEGRNRLVNLNIRLFFAYFSNFVCNRQSGENPKYRKI